VKSSARMDAPRVRKSVVNKTPSSAFSS
jgi:hypothetical protein